MKLVPLPPRPSGLRPMVRQSPVPPEDGAWTPRLPPCSVLFCGGGTLGHVTGALAVSRALADRHPHLAIHFAGTGAAAERRRVESRGWTYWDIPSAPWRPGPWGVSAFVTRQLNGQLAARRLLARVRPQIVVGCGGFASVPVAWAASHRRLPLVLLEQNAVAGRANRWLARRASVICGGYAEAAETLTGAPFRMVGNPVEPSGPAAPQPTIPCLVILGGSRGASDLNQHVPAALARCASALEDWKIIHQTGRADHAQVRAQYAASGVTATVVPLLDDLPALLPTVSLAITRSGGNVLSELANAGVPAILCPYPHARDDHQRHNALVCAAAGGCEVIDTRDSPADWADALTTTLQSLLAAPQRLQDMAQRQRARALPGAALAVAILLEEILVQALG